MKGNTGIVVISALALAVGGLLLSRRAHASVLPPPFGGVEVTWDSGLGDVDQDGWVTENDMDMVQEIMLGITPTAEQRRRADVNQDGRVNSTDISYVKAILDGRYTPS